MITNRIEGAYEQAKPKSTPGGEWSLPQTAEELKAWLPDFNQLLHDSPGICLASAFVLGAIIGWRIKRK